MCSEAVKLLLEHGANPLLQDKHGRNAMEIAQYSSDLGMVRGDKAIIKLLQEEVKK